jgi:adenine-specific DNA-methyltransferase
MVKHQKLQLTWMGKNERKNPEPRIFIEVPELSYNNKNITFSKSVNKITSENFLIHGDNLLALQALVNDFENKIKLIYIDPPYNTGNAFSSYDDGVEHSIWLDLMYERLEILQKLLSPTGVIAVQIDNSPNSITQQSPESAYLSIIMDEIFGRTNYIATLVWKKKGNPGNTAKGIGTITESILIFSKNKSKAVINKEPFEKKYKYNDENGDYNLDKFLKTDSGAYKRDTMKFSIIDPKTGEHHFPPNGQRWTLGKKSVENFIEKGLIVFLNGSVFFKNYKDGESSKLYNNLLLEHGSLKSAKEELVELGFEREDFETPKPEILMKTIIEMFSNEGDYVLDSFLGSGTTAAVAHKMNRKWIGIELGDHAYTFCKPRIDKVIDGEQGGVSTEVSWKGGGGYGFYELAPTLIKKDNFGQHIINPEYNPEMLASAIAKHEGYVYSPDDNIYWKQSKTNENSFLFVTTNHMSREVIESINQSMAEGEYLLIVCRSYDRGAEKSFKNIRTKKIPQSLLKNCEFDVENYNLNIVNPPSYEEDEMSEEQGGDNNE